MKSNNISTTVATPAKPLYNKPLSTRALKYETYHNSQLKIRPMLKSKDFILLYENKDFNHNRYTRLCQHVHSHTKRICADKYN